MARVLASGMWADVKFATSTPGILSPLLSLPVQQGFWRPNDENNGVTGRSSKGSLKDYMKLTLSPNHVEQRHEQKMQVYCINPLSIEGSMKK